jgi:antitoxin component YwqK of YwqJK toxin-antitoxin module
MKTLLVLISVFSSILITGCNQSISNNSKDIVESKQILDSGFTNKTEAKNLTVKGLKEGKWIEYRDSSYVTTKDTSAPYYLLTVYKADLPLGIERGFYKSGKLFCENPYIDGKLNGTVKRYFENGNTESEAPCVNDKSNGVLKFYLENGKLSSEISAVNGKLNGLWKSYYESGALRAETPYSNDTINGAMKGYYEDGKLKSTTVFKNGVAGEKKNYDENGNEIK